MLAIVHYRLAKSDKGASVNAHIHLTTHPSPHLNRPVLPNRLTRVTLPQPPRPRRSFLAGLLLALSLSVAFAGEDTASASHTVTPPHRLVVGYFGQWSVYEHFFVKNLVRSGAASQLDQINYAQGFVTGGRCSVADPNADLNLVFTAADSVNGIADQPASSFRGNFHQLAELKRLHPRLKILISLEGRASAFAADAQPAARRAFVASCVDIFLRGHLTASPNVVPGTPDQPGLFDGIDLDWEYPQPEDAANFIALLSELRQQMSALRPGLRLTIAVGPSPRMYPGVDMAAVSRLVDQVGIMNYDYSGPWAKTTGFLAPLYGPEGEGGTVEGSILAYKAAAVPTSKLLLGIPFYGYGWHAVGHSADGLFQPGISIRGDRPYSYLQMLLLSNSASASSAPPANSTPTTDSAPPATPPLPAPTSVPAHLSPLAPTPSSRPFVLHRDPRSHAPWLYDGDTFWTYEDPISIRYKADFAMAQHLGGIMAWELSEDAPDAALLKAARNRLNHPEPTHTP